MKTKLFYSGKNQPHPGAKFYWLGTVFAMSSAGALSPLPIAGSVDPETTTGPESPDDYFCVVRYLESAPVVLSVEPPLLLPNQRTLSAFCSDGRYLWEDRELAEIVSSELRFRRALVERARDNSGVCPALSTDQRIAAGLAAFEILRSYQVVPR